MPANHAGPARFPFADPAGRKGFF